MGEQYPVGECPICQCHCLKATKVTNIPKIKAQQRLESHPQHNASQSTKQETVAFLDRGNHIFANAKSDKIAEYQQLYNDRKLSVTPKSKSSIRRSVNNHASFSKAKSIVMQPPSRAVQKELRKSMKVYFYVSFTSILIHISILSSPLFQTIQHEDGPTKINYKGGVKDIRHNRAHHRSCNNRLNTAPIELVDSSQSSSSNKEDDSSNNDTVQRTTVSPVSTSSAQPTMLERARKQCLKKLSNKEQPPTPATKRHCSAL